MGMAPLRAAQHAGYQSPDTYAYTLEKEPDIIAALAKVQAQNAEISRMTRQKVLDIAIEAIDMARTMSDPMSMLRGVQELAKLCGYYAPEKKSIELSAAKEKARGELALLSEADLIEMAGGFKGVLEGEFEVVTDGRSSTAE